MMAGGGGGARELDLNTSQRQDLTGLGVSALAAPLQECGREATAMRIKNLVAGQDWVALKTGLQRIRRKRHELVQGGDL